MKKSQKIEVRVSRFQKHKIKRKAENADMSVSEYLRKSALNQKINNIETDNIHKLAVQLKKVGTNIWQIRKEILNNYSFSNTEIKEIELELKNLNNQYQEIQEQIQKLSERL